MPYKDPLKKKEQQARYRKEHKGQWTEYQKEYQKKYRKALQEADPEAYKLRLRERVRKSRAKHTLYKSKENALPTPEDLKS